MNDPPTMQSIYGDETLSDILAVGDLAGGGGDDKIYGGDELSGTLRYFGGPGSDLISVG